MPLTRPTLLADSSLEGRSKNDLLEIIINYIKNRATVTDLNLFLDILEDPSLMTYQRIATDERDGFFIQAAYIALALSLNERKISAFFGHKTTSSITLKNIISRRLGRLSRGLYSTYLDQNTANKN